MQNPRYLEDLSAARNEMESIEEVLVNTVTYDDIRKDALSLCRLLRKAIAELEDLRGTKT